MVEQDVTSTVKLLKPSQKGNMLEVNIPGTGKSGGTWFYLNEKVINFAKNLNPGDDIEIKYRPNPSGGAGYINFVKKVGGNGSGGETTTQTQTQTKTQTPSSGQGNKKPFDSETSVKQTAAHGASRIMIGLAGTYDINSVNEIFNSAYDNILNKLKGN